MSLAQRVVLRGNIHNAAVAALATLLLLLCSFTRTAMATEREERSTGARQTLIHNGIERNYLLRLPATLRSGSAKVPLVLVLHGGGGNADNAEAMTGFTRKAKKEGFIVVYPEGTGRGRNKLLTWNAGHCCGHAMNNKVDDVGFINALIDQIVERYPVDPQRIYATGMSNGAMMTHRLGIELSNRLAAIAPVVGTLFGDEKKPLYPVSALMLNGKLDQHVPHQGGPSGGHFSNAWDGTPTRPALDQAVFWADADGCTGGPDKTDQDSFTRWQYRCSGGIAVELYLVNDNGHAWPGGEQGSRMGDKPSSALDGTDVIWRFFKAHPK